MRILRTLLLLLLALLLFAVAVLPVIAAVAMPWLRGAGLDVPYGVGRTTLMWGTSAGFLLTPISLVLLVLAVVLVVRAVLPGGSSKEASKLSADESRLMQELHNGMARIEQRVEALETILLEHMPRSSGGTNRNHGSTTAAGRRNGL